MNYTHRLVLEEEEAPWEVAEIADRMLGVVLGMNNSDEEKENRPEQHRRPVHRLHGRRWESVCRRSR